MGCVRSQQDREAGANCARCDAGAYLRQYRQPRASFRLSFAVGDDRRFQFYCLLEVQNGERRKLLCLVDLATAPKRIDAVAINAERGVKVLQRCILVSKG